MILQFHLEPFGEVGLVFQEGEGAVTFLAALKKILERDNLRSGV